MTTAPTPPQVSEGKARVAAGVRHPGGQVSRVYYCRSCGTEQEAQMVPRGWYSMTRHTGQDARPSVRLGIYCSVDCLAQQLDRIQELHLVMGDRFDVSPFVMPKDGRA